MVERGFWGLFEEEGGIGGEALLLVVVLLLKVVVAVVGVLAVLVIVFRRDWVFEGFVEVVGLSPTPLFLSIV